MATPLLIMLPYKICAITLHLVLHQVGHHLRNNDQRSHTFEPDAFFGNGSTDPLCQLDAYGIKPIKMLHRGGY